MASPLSDLRNLAEKLGQTPDDADVYRTAGRTLLAAVGAGDLLQGWEPVARDACFRQLLRQTGCSAAPPILAHEAAGNLTSGNQKAVAAMVEMLKSVLHSEFISDPRENPGFKTVLVFLLTTRAVAGSWLDQDRLSALHLDWFEHFNQDDLSLPYSVMFSPELFGRNRDELLARYWPGQEPPLHMDAERVLFFEWLAQRDAFRAGDTDSVARYVGARDIPRETSGLKTLILRHWPRSKPLPNAWNLSELAPLLKVLTPGPSDLGATVIPKMQARPRQAVQVTRHVLGRRLPFLARSDRRVRVAACVSGQLRGYEQALQSWQRNFLGQADVTFFINSWRETGRADPWPSRQLLPFSGTHFSQAYRQVVLAEGYETVQDRYPTLFAILRSSAQASEEDLQTLYSTRHVVLDDETQSPFDGFSNQQKMHYKIAAANRMAEEAGEFDLHLRIRPDLEIALRAFDWDDMRAACAAGPVLFAEKSYGFHYGNLMIGDQFALASPRTMRAYADTWDVFPRLAQSGAARVPPELTGHISLALTSWMRGLRIGKIPVKFGQLCEARVLGSADIKVALDADALGDAVDCKLLQAVCRDLATGTGSRQGR